MNPYKWLQHFFAGDKKQELIEAQTQKDSKFIYKVIRMFSGKRKKKRQLRNAGRSRRLHIHFGTFSPVNKRKSTTIFY